MRTILLLILATALSLSAPARGAAAGRPEVIAYVSGASYEQYGECQGCEWRVYRPETDEDLLVATLPAQPHAVIWDERFERVEFRAGRALYRLRWALGARPERLGVLPEGWSPAPEDSEPWVDRSTGAWRVWSGKGRGKEYRLRVLELTPAGQWRTVAEARGCDSLDAACWDRARRARQPRAANTAAALHEAMRIEAHMPGTGFDPATADGEGGEPIQIPSRSVPNRALRTRAVMGDSWHALAPLDWVDLKAGRTRAIAWPETRCEASEQLAFAERGSFLLVVEEWSGRCPVVVDLRSGALRRSIPNAGLAAWVPAPAR